jgi:hypothetical protein
MRTVLVSLVSVCLVFAAAPVLSAADTIQSSSGQFTVGWKANPQSGRGTVSVWPTNDPADAVALGELDSFGPNVVHFSPGERFLVLQDRLSSGHFLVLFQTTSQKSKDGSQYATFTASAGIFELDNIIKQAAYCSAGLTNTGIGVDRDNVLFEAWTNDSQLKFNYSARLTQKNLEGNFYTLSGYQGIVDVAAMLVTQVTSPAQTDWNKDQPDKLLNQAYNQLKQTLSQSEKDKLAAEQKEWLAKRDDIQDLEEQNRFVLDRARELLGRMQTK